MSQRRAPKGHWHSEIVKKAFNYHQRYPSQVIYALGRDMLLSPTRRFNSGRGRVLQPSKWLEVLGHGDGPRPTALACMIFPWSFSSWLRILIF